MRLQDSHASPPRPALTICATTVGLGRQLWTPVLPQLEAEGGHAAANVGLRGGLQEEDPELAGTPAHAPAPGRARALRQPQLQRASHPLREDLGAFEGPRRQQAGDAGPRARVGAAQGEAKRPSRASCPTLPGSWVRPLRTGWAAVRQAARIPTRPALSPSHQHESTKRGDLKPSVPGLEKGRVKVSVPNRVAPIPRGRRQSPQPPPQGPHSPRGSARAGFQWDCTCPSSCSAPPSSRRPRPRPRRRRRARRVAQGAPWRAGTHPQGPTRRPRAAPTSRARRPAGRPSTPPGAWKQPGAGGAERARRPIPARLQNFSPIAAALLRVRGPA